MHFTPTRLNFYSNCETNSLMELGKAKVKSYVRSPPCATGITEYIQNICKHFRRVLVKRELMLLKFKLKKAGEKINPDGYTDSSNSAKFSQNSTVFIKGIIPQKYIMHI